MAARAHQLLVGVDQQLYDVLSVVDNARRGIHESSISLTTHTTRCSGLEKAFQDERQTRNNVVKAYNELVHQHQRAIKDLQVMSHKNIALQQQLKSIGHVNTSRSQEQERSLEAGEHDLKDIAKQVTDQVRELEERIAGTSQSSESPLPNVVTQKDDERKVVCQSTPAEQFSPSVSLNVENEDNGPSSEERRGRAKRLRRTRKALE
jgi:seryl-tRNA synthetase